MSKTLSPWSLIRIKYARIFINGLLFFFSCRDVGCPNLSYNNVHDTVQSTALETPVHSSQVEAILMNSNKDGILGRHYITAYIRD